MLGVAKARALELTPAEGRVTVADLQRLRLLDAAVAAVEELGWRRVTVANIAARARVSRRTFYDLFNDREDCLLAVCEDTTDRIAAEIAAATEGDGLAWLERLRTGLWVVLSFFDREPELARFCVVASAQGGALVLEHRSEILARLTAVVDEGRLQSARAAESPPLSAQGSVGGVLSIVQTRLRGSGHEPLRDMFGDLMGLLVLPYLQAKGARSESKRPAPCVTAVPATPAVAPAAHADNPLRGIPMRLTYRTALVLSAVAQHPGASNRAIGEWADIYDQGQVSKLLARLERIGLLLNTGEGHTKGEANAWHLTALGERVTRHLSLGGENQKDAA